MALVGYARVSTDAQSLGFQIDALKAAGCERIFTEKVSGAKADRPQLAKALDYMRQGDTLVVWKLDRLARSMAQLVVTIQRLEQMHIGFRCLTQPIDTTSASGRLVLGIFSALAEFERELIKERTNEGLAAARARGRKGGRPVLLTSEAWATIRAMLKGGASVTAAAKAAGVSRTPSIRPFDGPAEPDPSCRNIRHCEAWIELGTARKSAGSTLGAATTVWANGVTGASHALVAAVGLACRSLSRHNARLPLGAGSRQAMPRRAVRSSGLTPEAALRHLLLRARVVG